MCRCMPHTNVTRHKLSLRMIMKMIIRKTYAFEVIIIELIQKRKHHLLSRHSEGNAMLTSYPGASLTFSMFINLMKLLLSIAFHLF